MCACGRPILCKGVCRNCYQRAYYAQHKPEPAPPRPKPGTTVETASPCTYASAHRRVKKARGRATEHTCTCGQPATDWAYRNASEHEIRGLYPYRMRDGSTGYKAGAWSPLVWDYDPLCVACHAVRDARLVPSTAGTPRERGQIVNENRSL